MAIVAEANNVTRGDRKQILDDSFDCEHPPWLVDLNLSAYSDSCSNWASYWTRLSLCAYVAVWAAAAGVSDEAKMSPTDERTND